MRVLKKILSSQAGATLTNTMVGAAMLAGVAVVVSQSITDQRQTTIKLNGSNACVASVKSLMDNLKTLDNNNQGSITWGYSYQSDLGDPTGKNYEATVFDGARYNFRLIHDASNATLSADAPGALTDPNLPFSVDQLRITTAFDDSACSGGCNAENTAFNQAAQTSAATAIHTYQNLNSAATTLSFLYNDDATFCGTDGATLSGLPGWNAKLQLTKVLETSGLDYAQSTPTVRARIQAKNLISGDPADCTSQGSLTPFPLGSTGSGALSPVGFEVTLFLDYVDSKGVERSCNVKNIFSQAKLKNTPSVSTPVITPVNPGDQPDPSRAEFCGTAPSTDGAGDEYTPSLNVNFAAQGEGVESFCRIEYMDSNRGLTVATPYTGAAGTAPAGYEYSDSGWFACRVPTQSFVAGIDPQHVDPDDLVGSVYNNTNAAEKATVQIINKSSSTSNNVSLELRNVPEGKFTFSVFTVDASQTASSVTSQSFYVDLYRPIGTTGIEPQAGGIVGLFNDPDMRLYELRAQFPHMEASNYSTFEGSIYAQLRQFDNLFQCKAGQPSFQLGDFQEMYTVTDRSIRWYFGPSDVSDANLTTYMGYTSAEVNTFNLQPAASHPLKFHDKEMIVEGVGGSQITGPNLNDIGESGEWVVAALPKDNCGEASGGTVSRRTWIVDFEDFGGDPAGGITVEVEAGATSVTKDRVLPADVQEFRFNGSKPKHKVGRQAGTYHLPHAYVCEFPNGGAIHPDASETDKTNRFYPVYDWRNTIPYGYTADGYDPANGQHILTYRTQPADSDTFHCGMINQFSNFNNACFQDTNSQMGVVVVDACGRVKGDTVLYELRGMSDGYSDSTIDGDVCKQVDCGPGYFCDKSTTGDGVTGICKTQDEIEWTALQNRASSPGSYPFQNCTGRNCGTTVYCGVDADCANDTGTIATCNSSSLACTNGGVDYSSGGSDITVSSSADYTPTMSPSAPNNQLTTYITSGIPQCLPSSAWSDKIESNTAATLEECSFYSGDGNTNVACDFDNTETNSFVEHDSNGLRTCPTVSNTHHQWAQYTSTDCDDYNNGAPLYDCSLASIAEGATCSTSGDIRWCNTGRSSTGGSPTYVLTDTNACVTTTASCSGTMDLQFYDYRMGYCTSQFECSAGNTGPCSAPTDAGNFSCNPNGPECDIRYCWCTGTYTPAGDSCAGHYGSVGDAPACTTATIGSEIKVKAGSTEYVYECQATTSSCVAPYHRCDLENGIPPWNVMNENIDITFKGECNVQKGTCEQSGFSATKSNSGAVDNLACPNMDPLSGVGCAVPSCSTYQGQYCSGVNFTLSIPACAGGGSVTCSGANGGTTTPNCDHLTPGVPGDYTLLTGRSITQCLADGYTDCQSASALCTGQTYTCAATNACMPGQIQYSNQSDCENSHDPAACTQITSGPDSGDWCGQGCPTGVFGGTSESACNAGGDRGCFKIHPDISGVNNYCSTKCDSSDGTVTYGDLASCESVQGAGNCTATETVYDNISTSSTYLSAKTVYCSSGANSCPSDKPNKYLDIVNCIADRGLSACFMEERSGSCQSYATCDSGSPIFKANVVDCNGTHVELGSNVSPSCCDNTSGPCSYKQDFRYLDDDTGVERSAAVFCAETGTTPSGSCEWEVNYTRLCVNSLNCANHGLIATMIPEDTAVTDGAACTAGDSPRYWHDDINHGGAWYVQDEYRANCVCTGSGTTTPGTCGTFEKQKTFSGGTLVANPRGALPYTPGTCEAACKTACEADGALACKFELTTARAGAWNCGCYSSKTSVTLTTGSTNDSAVTCTPPSGGGSGTGSQVWQLAYYGCDPSRTLCSASVEGQSCANENELCVTDNTCSGPAAEICTDPSDGPNCGSVFRCVGSGGSGTSKMWTTGECSDTPDKFRVNAEAPSWQANGTTMIGKMTCEAAGAHPDHCSNKVCDSGSIGDTCHIPPGNCGVVTNVSATQRICQCADGSCETAVAETSCTLGDLPTNSDHCYDSGFANPPFDQFFASYNRNGSSPLVGDGAADKWSYVQKDYNNAIKRVSQAEVWCTPKVSGSGGGGGPTAGNSGPTDCTAYWCAGDPVVIPPGSGCWEAVTAIDYSPSLNPVWSGMSRCTGDCSPTPAAGNSCTIGQMADVDLKYSTQSWSCTTSACSTEACTFSGGNSFTVESYPYIQGGTENWMSSSFRLVSGISQPGKPGTCGGGASTADVYDPNSIAWVSANSGMCGGGHNVPGPRGLFATCQKTMDNYQYRMVVTETGFDAGGDMFFMEVGSLGDIDFASNYDSGWIDINTVNLHLLYQSLNRGEVTVTQNRTSIPECGDGYFNSSTFAIDFYIRDKSDNSVMSSKSFTVNHRCSVLYTEGGGPTVIKE